MATITEFGKRHNRGWRIGSLPMPDGSKRAYKEYGRNAIAIILAKWAADKAAMQVAMYKAGEA